MLADRTWILSIGGLSADATAWRTALERARMSRIRVYQRDGSWWATSATRSGAVYNLGDHGESCNCDVGRHGKLCHHRAAVVSAQIKAGTMAECDACGELLPISQMVEHYRHIGGIGEVLKYYCGPAYGHQAGIAAESRAEVAA